MSDIAALVESWNYWFYEANKYMDFVNFILDTKLPGIYIDELLKEFEDSQNKTNQPK